MLFYRGSVLFQDVLLVIIGIIYVIKTISYKNMVLPFVCAIESIEMSKYGLNDSSFFSKYSLCFIKMCFTRTVCGHCVSSWLETGWPIFIQTHAL